jgi:uncharacterized membrane protein
MLRTIILNALFVVAEYASSNVNALVYRLAIVAIVMLIHTLWFRAMIRRAQNQTINEIDRRRHAHASQRAHHGEMSAD